MGCCRGVCCAAFPYPATPEDLIDRWRGVTRPLTETQAEFERDDLYIADMLIELPYEDRVERAEKYDLGSGLRLDYTAFRDKPFYTCRHWDENSKLCTAYKDRPTMCKDFPYNSDCEHGCGYTAPTETRTKWAAINVRAAAGGYD